MMDDEEEADGGISDDTRDGDNYQFTTIATKHNVFCIIICMI